MYYTPFTGKAILKLDSVYTQGQPLDGILTLSLKEGELIPASSKIIFENQDNKYEYFLSDYILEERQEGDFYIDGLNISGSGEGYGFEGISGSYPKVDFKLKIISSSDTSISETSSDNSESPEDAETQTSSEQEAEKQTEISEQDINQESQETNEAKESSEVKEEKLEKKEEKAEEKEQKKEDKNAESETPQSPITGNVVSGFFKNIFTFFLTITGRVSLDAENEIQGFTYADTPFEYELVEGQTAEIVPGSVTIGGRNIGDSKVNLKVQNGKAIVTTDYANIGSQGFGKEYLGDKTKDFEINLSKINLPLEEGDLKISLVHNDTNIISLSVKLSEGNLNAASEVNESEVSESNVVILMDANLTEEERNVLIEKFGNVSVNVLSAQQNANGKSIKFEIGNYWADRFYSNDLSAEELNSEIQRDIALFLKDIARDLLSGENKKENLEGIVGSHGI